MKITMLDGNPDAGNVKFDDYLKDLAALLEDKGHRVTRLRLREMTLEYCTGCWGCWVKTPGLCVIPDDSDQVRRAYIAADLVLFASPVIMGFTSALLKRAHDKLIPLIHPYFELVDKEVHHIGRYDTYPLMGLLLEKGQDTDEEDLEIITDIYRRDAINIKSSLYLAECTDRPVEEVIHEIDRI